MDQFLLPKDPCLSLRMLLPLSGRKLPCMAVTGSRTYYLFWARNAIYHALRVLKVSPGDNVLVPSFHCTSVVEPILRYGAKVKFYEIGRDLRADAADITSKIDGKTRALLSIHYFGFPQPMQTLKQLCQDQGIFLIEDCAHVLVGSGDDGTPMGGTGDISIFSWRKFLPLYDGGQLVINNAHLEGEIRLEREGKVFRLKVAKNILDKLIEDSESRTVQKLARVSRWPSRVARRLTCATGRAPVAFKINSYDLDFDLALANLGMSSLSKYILRHLDIEDVAEKRRANYSRLLDEIPWNESIAPLQPRLPPQVCPWVFPLLAVNRADFHLVLRERGVPAFTWSGVIHQDLPLERFPNAKFFYDHLVFLPVHQSISAKQIELMIEVLSTEVQKCGATPNSIRTTVAANG